MKDLWLNEKEAIMPLSATKNEIDGIPAAIRNTVSNLSQIRTVLRDPLIISPKRNHVRIDFEQAGLQLRASLPSLLCS